MDLDDHMSDLSGRRHYTNGVSTHMSDSSSDEDMTDAELSSSTMRDLNHLQASDIDAMLDDDRLRNPLAGDSLSPAKRRKNSFGPSPIYGHGSLLGSNELWTRETESDFLSVER